jgi:hypothetical protein
VSDNTNKPLALQELPELRHKTESVSRFLQAQIASHFETLRPLFAPERIFGKLAGGKVEVTGTERAVAELQQSYKAFTRKPYDLPETLDPSWLTLVGNALVLHPWEYVHHAQGKEITISSPVRWTVQYRSSYTLAQVRSVVESKDSARPDSFRQFVVNSLVLQLVLNRNSGLVQLFRDLRYDLKTEAPPDLNGLPIVTVTSFLTSFRPADDVITAATAFSGVPVFIELLDLDALKRVVDPLQTQLDGLLK